MKPPRLFKALLVGLPLGLIIIGTGSVFWTVTKPKTAETDKSGTAPRSKPVSRADLEFYVQRLATDIGPRPTADNKKTRECASFIEGTLGPNNIGYQNVQREPFTTGDQTSYNLYIDLPGTAPTTKMLIIGANYDSATDEAGANDNATGVSATLALAQQFLGSKHPSTIRFVFFGNGRGAGPSGAEIMAKTLHGRKTPVVAMVNLDRLGIFNAPNALHFLSNDSDLLKNCVQLFPTLSSLEALGKMPSPNFPQPFSRSGFPEITATAIEPQQPGTSEKIDFPKFTEAVRSLGRMIEALAQ